MESGWGNADADVLSHVLQRLLPFPGQVGQCRLVCSGWKHAIARAQNVTVTLQHGQASSATPAHSAETLSLVNSYLHCLPKHSAMHAHADMVHRQSPSSNPAHTVAAKPRDPDSILPSRRVSSLTGFSAEYEETLPINLDTQADSFPLSWPPARPDSAYGDAQISAGAQVRDLDAWYRSFVTVSPYVEDSSTETLAAPAQHPRRTSTRGGAAVTPSDTHEVPADMLMQVMMDLDVCKQLLADIAALDTTRAPKEHVACLQHLKVALESAFQPRIAPAASLTHTPRRGARFARGCITGTSPTQPALNPPSAAASSRISLSRKRLRTSAPAQPPRPEPPRFHEEPEVATGDLRAPRSKQARSTPAAGDHAGPSNAPVKLMHALDAQTPAASTAERAQQSEVDATVVSSQCQFSSSPLEKSNTARFGSRRPNRSNKSDSRLCQARPASALTNSALLNVVDTGAMGDGGAGRHSIKANPAKMRTSKATASAGTAHTKGHAARSDVVILRKGEQRSKDHACTAAGTSSQGVPGVAAAQVTARLVRSTQCRREPDWNPELYYTAYGPSYRGTSNKGGKGGLQRWAPSMQNIGALPVRDRGFKGGTGAAAADTVSVEFVAPVATLERAAAAIAMSALSCVSQTGRAGGQLAPENDGDENGGPEAEAGKKQEAPATATSTVPRTRKPAAKRAKKGAKTAANQVKSTAVAHVSKGPKSQKRKGSKQKKTFEDDKTASEKALVVMSNAERACPLQHGQACRAFAFEVLAAALAMHKERNALVSVLGQANTLDLSHTPCVGTTFAATFPTSQSVKSLHIGSLPISPHAAPNTPTLDAAPGLTLGSRAHQPPTHPRCLSTLFSRLPLLQHLSLTLDYSNLPAAPPSLLPAQSHDMHACASMRAASASMHANSDASPHLLMPHYPSMLRTLCVTVRPRRLSPSRTPLVLPPHALLPHLSALSLTYGLVDTELESFFTAARMAPIAQLPSLKHLSVTTINHSFEQAAADALAKATHLTSLELLRCVPSVPMNFFDFHNGVAFLRPMAASLRRLKINDARYLCHSRDEDWRPLATLTKLESLVMSGAHLNWKDYTPISHLTALSELQLAHCSGALPLAWLQCMPHLRRLYLKGNGASISSMISLCGGPQILASLESLEELYLGLCLFTEHDGHTPISPAPSVTHLSSLHRLRCLTISDSPFDLHPPSEPGCPRPLHDTLLSLRSLQKLRIGHSSRVYDLRGLSQHDATTSIHDVHALYSCVGQLNLEDLTLDCHPYFNGEDLRAALAGNTCLKQLRLLGSSSCVQRDLLPLAALLHLTRLVIGARFVLCGSSASGVATGAAGASTSSGSGMHALRAHAFGGAAGGSGSHSGGSTSRHSNGKPGIDSTFKRMLEGLLPHVSGSLRVLVVHGALGEALRETLRCAPRFRSILVGMDCSSVFSRLPPPVDTPTHPGAAGSVVPQEDAAHPVLPQPHGPPPLNPAQWDTWPYDCASDDEEYGRNVPAWYDNEAELLADIDEDEDDDPVMLSDDEDTDGDADGDGAADEDDDDEQIYDFGDFFDPFNRKMWVQNDSDDEIFGDDDEEEEDEGDAADADDDGDDDDEEEDDEEEDNDAAGVDLTNNLEASAEEDEDEGGGAEDTLDTGAATSGWGGANGAAAAPHEDEEGDDDETRNAAACTATAGGGGASISVAGGAAMHDEGPEDFDADGPLYTGANAWDGTAAEASCGSPRQVPGDLAEAEFSVC